MIGQHYHLLYWLVEIMTTYILSRFSGFLLLIYSKKAMTRKFRAIVFSSNSVEQFCANGPRVNVPHLILMLLMNKKTTIQRTVVPPWTNLIRLMGFDLGKCGLEAVRMSGLYNCHLTFIPPIEYNTFFCSHLRLERSCKVIIRISRTLQVELEMGREGIDPNW